MSHIGRLKRKDLVAGWYWAFANGVLQCVRVEIFEQQTLDTMFVSVVNEIDSSVLHEWREDEMIFIHRIELPTIRIEDGDYHE